MPNEVRVMRWVFSAKGGKALAALSIAMFAVLLLRAVTGGPKIPIYKDEARTLTSVQNHIPIGTAVDSARRTIERSGFQCRIDDGIYGSRLYCAKVGWSWAILVVPEWRVSLWLDSLRRVKEVTVTYGLTGP